jgi:hypothetical protein
VRRIVREVNSFDNVILEICDEPFSYGTPRALVGPWIGHLVEVVKQTESTLPQKHLLGQQIQGRIGGPVDFTAHADVPVIVTQYVWQTPDEQVGGMKALDFLYGRNKPIDLNETGYYPLASWYEGDKAGAVRVEAWEFIVGGGSSFNNLNGVYTVRDPSGRAAENKPVLEAMQSLKQFIQGFDFLKMRPDRSFVVNRMPAGTYYRGISERGEQYALYHHHSRLKDYVYKVLPGTYEERVILELPPGTYQANWVNPSTGAILGTETFTHAGGQHSVSTPKHAVDVALRIKRQRGSMHDVSDPLHPNKAKLFHLRACAVPHIPSSRKTRLNGGPQMVEVSLPPVPAKAWSASIESHSMIVMNSISSPASRAANSWPVTLHLTNMRQKLWFQHGLIRGSVFTVCVSVPDSCDHWTSFV